MSAYGTIAVTGRQIDLLPPISWELPEPVPGKPAAPFRRLVLHHLRLDSAGQLPGLLEYTHQVFAAEIEVGRTYPQEGDTGLDATCMTTTSESRVYTRAAFEAYFWAADVVIAIGTNADDGSDPGLIGDVEAVRVGRSWEDILVGFYYVKPNYPGRSSHVSDCTYILVSNPARQALLIKKGTRSVTQGS
jgi:hypothetical protein